MTDSLLTLTGLTKSYGPVMAVRGIDLAIDKGEFVAIMGPSGCGKTTTLRMIAGLEKPTGGEIRLRERLMNDVRPWERDTPLVWQSLALFPFLSVIRNVEFGLKMRGIDGAARRQKALAWLERLGIAEFADRDVGTLSGGQRQRVAIARAFAGDPDVVLCDEPVSNLDVSVQATILTLLADLQQRESVSYFFISHDLAVIRYLADRVGVMYLGSLVEVGSVAEVFSPPFHPYTETLFAAMPTLDGIGVQIRADGTVPSQAAIPSGCPFHTRCPRFLGQQCVDEVPPWQEAVRGHGYRCWIPPGELAEQQAETWSGAAEHERDAPTYNDGLSGDSDERRNGG
jgi:oligopeptide/dipeptide ABC transporter ATP-binding protein